jgi:hypothetical protein
MLRPRTAFLIDSLYVPWSESGYLKIGERFVRVVSVEYSDNSASSCLCVRTLWPWEETYVQLVSQVRDLNATLEATRTGVTRLVEFFR